MSQSQQLSKKKNESARHLRELRFSLVALLAAEAMVYALLGFEFVQIVRLDAVAHEWLIFLRLGCSALLAVGLGLLMLRQNQGWKIALAAQLGLIIASLFQISLFDQDSDFNDVLTLFGIFFQIAALRLLFLRPLVFLSGVTSIKKWFKERRVGVRVPCQLLFSSSPDGNNAESLMVDLSLSGCLFWTTSNLENVEWLIISPENARDLQLKASVKKESRNGISVPHFFELRQDVELYSGSFETKLTDESFNRILRGKSPADLPLRSV